MVKSIMVLGNRVSIKVVKSLPDDDFGQFQYGQNRILIKESNPEHMYRILHHEYMHALLVYSGLSDLLDDKMEEALCSLAEHNAKVFLMKG